MNRIKNIFLNIGTPNRRHPKFSELKSKDQKRIIEEAVRESNKEQKELLDEYKGNKLSRIH